MKGRYLAFEGIEGAGKSTVVAAVTTWLQVQGIDVVAVREPGGTPLGEQIRQILLDPEGAMVPWAEAMLFSAARSELAAEVVAPALADGTWVVSDRSVYSSLAYQGGGRGLGIDQVRVVNEAGLGGVWPELVILLRVAPESGLDRQHDPDRIGGAGIELQHRVSAAFDTLAEAEPHRFLVVDASLPVDEVVATVCAGLEERWTISSMM